MWAHEKTARTRLLHQMIWERSHSRGQSGHADLAGMESSSATSTNPEDEGSRHGQHDPDCVLLQARHRQRTHLPRAGRHCRCASLVLGRGNAHDTVGVGVFSVQLAVRRRRVIRPFVRICRVVGATGNGQCEAHGHDHHGALQAAHHTCTDSSHRRGTDLPECRSRHGSPERRPSAEGSRTPGERRSLQS